MAYQITFTKRFEKHFKCLNTQENKQFQNKLRLLAAPPLCTRPYESNASREPKACPGVVSTWMSALSGTMKAAS